MIDTILSRNKARDLGDYCYEFRKVGRLLKLEHVNFFLEKVFKPNVFGCINEEINVSNYISNFIQEVKKFSKFRNKAAHTKTISKEVCDKWLDKMLGSGNMLQNFLSKLRID